MRTLHTEISPCIVYDMSLDGYLLSVAARFRNMIYQLQLKFDYVAHAGLLSSR